MCCCACEHAVDQGHPPPGLNWNEQVHVRVRPEYQVQPSHRGAPGRRRSQLLRPYTAARSPPQAVDKAPGPHVTG